MYRDWGNEKYWEIAFAANLDREGVYQLLREAESEEEFFDGLKKMRLPDDDLEHSLNDLYSKLNQIHVMLEVLQRTAVQQDAEGNDLIEEVVVLSDQMMTQTASAKKLVNAELLRCKE